jgi:hypothetical protein
MKKWVPDENASRHYPLCCSHGFCRGLHFDGVVLFAMGEARKESWFFAHLVSRFVAYCGNRFENRG